MARKAITPVSSLKLGDVFTFLPASHNLPGAVEISELSGDKWKLVYGRSYLERSRVWYGSPKKAVKLIRRADGNQS